VSAPQLDAGAARESADRFARLADNLGVLASEDLTHRMVRLEEAVLAADAAVKLRTYAALIEADDYIEPRGPRP
jgi:hypothetical protein